MLLNLQKPKSPAVEWELKQLLCALKWELNEAIYKFPPVVG